ncbi:hypothetical protein TrLO_g4935 [Triparma laevis f. longispina]|uniref:Uncharacterized protein n=1 Tax=Triparma laevis f. longispina TaxID=1714387 RepID=A0A9W7C8A1_9STRA|nr:hypothetical protein TrLO_g4935 [Triparma laevis f. longispina]
MATEEEEMGETTPQSVQSARSGRWTDNEQLIFLQGLRKYGKGQWKLISREITTRSVTQIKSHAQKFLKKIAAGENIFKMLDSPEAEGNLTMPSYDFFNVGTGSAATKGVDFKQEMLAKTYVNSGKPTRVKNPVVKNAVVINMRLLNEPEFEDLFATWKDHSLPLGAWTTGMHSLLKEKFPLLLKKYNYFDTDRRKAFCQFLMDKKKSNRKAEVGASKGVGFKHDLLAETTKITSSTGMSAAPSHVVWSCVPQHDEYKQSDSTSNIDAYLRWENLQAPRTE